jgi:DNA-binding response OmpR family regulator
MKEINSILIVDDDPDDREFLTDAITEIDPMINCITANEGQEALSLLRALKTLPEYIFLDLNMHGLNGKKCLSEIKKDKQISSPQVIIYTTCKIEADVKEIKELGASYFILKPNTHRELRDIIASILSKTKKLPNTQSIIEL